MTLPATVRRVMSLQLIAAAVLLLVLPERSQAQTAAVPSSAVPQRDGRNDFDFLRGDWSVHLRRLPDRLVGSTTWLEYDGSARVRQFLGSSADVEEFEVDNAASKLHIKGQTLLLYNQGSHQWSLSLLDVDNGLLSMPPMVGRFTEGRGEFFDQEEFRGRMILVRYVWTHDREATTRMEQSFSDDGGRTWEANWICDMTRRPV